MNKRNKEQVKEGRDGRWKGGAGGKILFNWKKKDISLEKINTIFRYINWKNDILNGKVNAFRYNYSKRDI